MMDSHPLYLNGKFVQTDKTLAVVNPATGEQFASVSTVQREQVRTAISDARAAFAAWSGMTAQARGQILNRIADELDRQKDEIARLVTLENGKPLSQSLGEVAMSVDHLRWF